MLGWGPAPIQLLLQEIAAESAGLTAAHQLNEVICHAPIVLVHSVHDCINESLLVTLTQLSDVAKVHVGDAAIPQSKDVARVRIAME